MPSISNGRVAGPRPGGQPRTRSRVLPGWAFFSMNSMIWSATSTPVVVSTLLEPRRGVDLRDHRPVVGAEDVDAGRCSAPWPWPPARRVLRSSGVSFMPFGGAAPVRGSTGSRRAAPAASMRGDHAVADDEAADVVAAVGLLDVLLDEDVGVELPEGGDRPTRPPSWSRHSTTPTPWVPSSELHDHGAPPTGLD